GRWPIRPGGRRTSSTGGASPTRTARRARPTWRCRRPARRGACPEAAPPRALAGGGGGRYTCRMPEPPRIVPVACPFGQGSVVYVYYVDAPEPALIDTGVAASPAGVLEPALAAAGFRLDDVRWILATHGHYDHLGAAHALKRRLPAARVGVHADDHFLMRHRAAHLDGYAGVRARFLDDPAVLAQTDALLLECISGEMAADRELREGDHVNLGGDLTFTVVHTPGHSRGSSSFVLDGPG